MCRNERLASGGRVLLEPHFVLKLEMQNSSVLLFPQEALEPLQRWLQWVRAHSWERKGVRCRDSWQGAEGWCARAAHPRATGVVCARATRPQPLSVSGPTGVESMSAAAAASDKTNNNANAPIVAVGGEWMARWWCLMCHKNRHGQFEFYYLVKLLRISVSLLRIIFRLIFWATIFSDFDVKVHFLALKF